jgi:hypothetical protein
VLAHAKTVKRFRELNIRELIGTAFLAEDTLTVTEGQIAFKSDNFV